MKLRTYNEEVMTQLTDQEHKAQMAAMKSFDEQMPCVGIFWYNPEEHRFFGVHKKEVTPKMAEEAAEKGSTARTSGNVSAFRVSAAAAGSSAPLLTAFLSPTFFSRSEACCGSEAGTSPAEVF